jgi:hypothetical protein
MYLSIFYLIPASNLLKFIYKLLLVLLVTFFSNDYLQKYLFYFFINFDFFKFLNYFDLILLLNLDLIIHLILYYDIYFTKCLGMSYLNYLFLRIHQFNPFFKLEQLQQDHYRYDFYLKLIFDLTINFRVKDFNLLYKIDFYLKFKER